jgi:hypothetical protein
VDGKPSVVDLKSGAARVWHRLQTAAYAAMLERPFTRYRLIVRVKEDGEYKMDWFAPDTYAADLSVFLAALTIHNFKLMNGIK